LTAADLAFLISLGGALDSTPPVLTNGAPTGALPSGTTQTTMSLTTDENAVCRYSSTPNTSYASMTGTFTNTGATAHSTTLTGLVDGNAYTRYVRCRDGALNANGADYPIAFSVSVNRFLTVSSWAAFVPAANGVGTLPKGYKGGVFDGRYAYFVPNFKGNSEVMRFDTAAPFSAASSWATYDPNPPSGGGYVGGAFDGRYVYFAPYHNGTQSIGEVLRYDTQSPFTSQASWSTFDPSANGVGVSPKGYWGAFFDGRYVYFSPEWQSTIKEHGEVLRYDTTLPFTQAASWRTYDAGAHGVGTDPDGYKGIGSDGTYLYFVPYYNGTASHGEVLRYDRRGAFDVVSSWATYTPAANGVGNIAKGFEDAVFDGRYLYFVPSYSGTGSNAYHGEVLRYDTLAPFQTASSWAAFDPGSNGVGLDPDGYNGGTFDGRFIYFAPTNNGTGPHGEVLMYDTTKPFNSAGSWLTYDPGAHGIGTDPDGFAGTIFDQRYVYFVPDRNETGVPSGEVLRYDTGTTLQTTTVAALTVHDTSSRLDAAARERGQLRGDRRRLREHAGDAHESNEWLCRSVVRSNRQRREAGRRGWLRAGAVGNGCGDRGYRAVSCRRHVCRIGRLPIVAADYRCGDADGDDRSRREAGGPGSVEREAVASARRARGRGRLPSDPRRRSARRFRTIPGTACGRPGR
jgi:hypothetical protein